ncbi:MAG: DsrE family protein [Thaumarchaeota archaeon]|jgi:peroxiredoxin family protein|nr:DsrE family protein [Candidatus Geocrenenecus arthurdayi]
MGKKAIIINTASYERVAFALSLAAAYSTLGEEVSILFTYGGVLRLKKGHEDEIGEETNAWIKKEVSIEERKDSLPKISEYLRVIRSFGGRIYACPAAMAFHNLTRDELTDDLDGVRGIVSFLVEDAKDATLIYV